MMDNGLMMLKARHTALDRLIVEEEKCRVIDVLFVTAMKKQKLYLKDEIVRVEHDEIKRHSTT
jgi:uncharacterized protein YdcH (DUF465 family)